MQWEGCTTWMSQHSKGEYATFTAQCSKAICDFGENINISGGKMKFMKSYCSKEVCAIPVQ